MGGVPWTEEEDHLLKKCIEQFGEGKWHRVPLLAGLNRCRKSCRLRWLNYLRPNIRRGSFTAEEVELIIKLHKLLGNRWSLIAGRLTGRTANDVKNYWNCHLSKKLSTKQMETDSEENTDIGNVQILQPQPLDLSSIVPLKPGRRVGREEASCYYPQQESPLADVTTSTQFMISRTDVQEEEKKTNLIEGNDIVQGDLSAEFQFDDVSVGGFGSNKHCWDWDDLFMDMDLWNSSF